MRIKADTSDVQQKIERLQRELNKLSKSVNLDGDNSGGLGIAKQMANGGVQKSSTTSNFNAPLNRRLDRHLRDFLKELRGIKSEISKMNFGDLPINPLIAGLRQQNSANLRQQNSVDPDYNPSLMRNQDAFQRLATTGGKLWAAHRVWKLGERYVDASLDRERQAYEIYQGSGTNLTYEQLAKNAQDVGIKNGYDGKQTLETTRAYLRETGFDKNRLGDYNKDIQSIQETSRAFGLDANSVSSVFGSISRSGAINIGEQKTLETIFTRSMDRTKMAGRQEEQLRVMEGLDNNLANSGVAVSGEALADAMELYSRIAENNPHLRGEKGADIVNSITSLNKSDSFESLARMMPEYQGIEGRVRMREDREKNPVEFAQKMIKQADILSGGNEILTRNMLAEALQGNQAKADALYKAQKLGIKDNNLYRRIYEGKDDDMGKIQEELNKFETSGFGANTRAQANETNAEARAGEILKPIKTYINKTYNALGPTGQLITSVGSDVLNAAAPGIFMSMANRLFEGKSALPMGNILQGMKASANGIGTFGKSLGGSLGSFGSRAMAKGGALWSTTLGNTAIGQSIGSGVSSMAGSIGKNAPAIVGKAGTLGTGATVLQAGISAYRVVDALQKDNKKEAAGAAGAGIGNVLGGVVGAMIGGPIGAMIGSTAGGMIGEFIGEKLYEVTSDTNEMNKEAVETFKEATEDFKSDVEKEESLVEKDNKDLVKNNTPLAVNQKQAGVKATNLNVQNELEEKTTEDNTDAIEKNTEAINKLASRDIESLPKESAISEIDAKQKKDEEKSWWDLLFKNPNEKHFAVGTDRVPFDGVRAVLHRDEAVLNRFDAEEYRRGNTNKDESTVTSTSTNEMTLNINISGAIQGMTQENQQMIVQAVVSQINGGGLQGMLSNGFTRIANA